MIPIQLPKPPTINSGKLKLKNPKKGGESWVFLGGFKGFQRAFRVPGDKRSGTGTIVLRNHYSLGTLSSLVAGAICSHLNNKLNVANVVLLQLQIQFSVSVAFHQPGHLSSSSCCSSELGFFMRSAKAIKIAIIFQLPHNPHTSCLQFALCCLVHSQDFR